MKIIIVGGGKVGHQIGKKLTNEKHDVVIIDDDPDVLARISDEMDVFCVEGNGADYKVQSEAGAGSADILIAATAHDEINMLCCLIAHKLGAKHTIARVRDPEYTVQLDFLKDELGLSMAINPELAAADEIARLLRIPSALNVELFARGRVELVEFRIGEGNPLIGLSLMQIYKKYQIKILICAVQRGTEVIIPNGEFELEQGDRLHITASHEELALSKVGVQVKIIESNPRRAEQLSEDLDNALIICGDSTDHDLLIQEGINSVDAFVSLTGMDENNIISGLFAKWQGAGRVIAKVNNEGLCSIVPENELDCIISPKTITANQILTFVRAMDCSPEGSNVDTVHQMVGGKIEAIEFSAKGNHPMYGRPLKELKRSLHKDLLIACIVRGEKTIIPGGDDCIKAGDRVIVVTKHILFNDLTDVLTGNLQ